MKKRRRHTSDQIITKLREADVALGRGERLAQILKGLEVSEQTLWVARKLCPLSADVAGGAFRPPSPGESGKEKDGAGGSWKAGKALWVF